ncbi:hypothetical protein CC1G_14881 [Coprinopsis cinerea okayama7|uniref:Uncharacterized protein n=1 Tax=Coprinopsis cinerea (strain Okayama-7 / 130 / ATCC MYA-4618 / FGSC 9003) TaxID=240176 RepID=D6RNJ4_COPC7|nr:hypothetical protein CC1G_14881 [Coprinopsis cinerea okayama7\|eukprot:XP_002910904.1 hypothetical protein CC1G_14881 [Coprinopsis cinerea okayama7\
MNTKIRLDKLGEAEITPFKLVLCSCHGRSLPEGRCSSYVTLYRELTNETIFSSRGSTTTDCALASRYLCSADPLDVASSSSENESEKYLPEDSLEDNCLALWMFSIPWRPTSYLWPQGLPNSESRLRSNASVILLIKIHNITLSPDHTIAGAHVDEAGKKASCKERVAGKPMGVPVQIGDFVDEGTTMQTWISKENPILKREDKAEVEYMFALALIEHSNVKKPPYSASLSRNTT